MDRVPEFWSWLAHHGEQGNIKIPVEIYEELKGGNDELAVWLKTDAISAALKLDGAAEVDVVRVVIYQGYAPDLLDDEIERLGRDPFLIAHALTEPDDRTVITTEVSKPGRTRAKRYIPDVCAQFDLPCGDTFDLTVALDFRTNWSR